ncbi:hypothetical protein GDO81_016613 [Engystomops pustulosus]|uniref:Uncharacterized protein n=1 Tax=Engystomops pustulosus TaxID=76066 RepID=A0AAV7A743_ENGPU|nr:hypothetical protein GDO81_016613 [Engystomops pustulosus]
MAAPGAQGQYVTTRMICPLHDAITLVSILVVILLSTDSEWHRNLHRSINPSSHISVSYCFPLSVFTVLLLFYFRYLKSEFLSYTLTLYTKLPTHNPWSLYSK